MRRGLRAPFSIWQPSIVGAPAIFHVTGLQQAQPHRARGNETRNNETRQSELWLKERQQQEQNELERRRRLLEQQRQRVQQEREEQEQRARQLHEKELEARQRQLQQAREEHQRNLQRQQQQQQLQQQQRLKELRERQRQQQEKLRQQREHQRQLEEQQLQQRREQQRQLQEKHRLQQLERQRQLQEQQRQHQRWLQEQRRKQQQQQQQQQQINVPWLRNHGPASETYAQMNYNHVPQIHLVHGNQPGWNIWRLPSPQPALQSSALPDSSQNRTLPAVNETHTASNVTQHQRTVVRNNAAPVEHVVTVQTKEKVPSTVPAARNQPVFHPVIQQPYYVQSHIPQVVGNPFAGRVPYFNGFQLSRPHSVTSLVAPDVAVGTGGKGQVTSESQVFQNGRPVSQINTNQDFTVITKVRKFDGDLLRINYTFDSHGASPSNKPAETASNGQSILNSIKKLVRRFRPNVEVDSGENKTVRVSTQIYQNGRHVTTAGVDSSRQFVIVTTVRRLQGRPLSVRYTFLPISDV